MFLYLNYREIGKTLNAKMLKWKISVNGTKFYLIVEDKGDSCVLPSFMR